MDLDDTPPARLQPRSASALDLAFGTWYGTILVILAFGTHTGMDLRLRQSDLDTKLGLHLD